MSEQITVVLPRVSTAGSLRIMAFLWAMRATPMARVMVTTMGSPSGMAATAAATAVMNMSSALIPTRMPMRNSNAEATMMMMPMLLANRSIFSWRGDLVMPISCTSEAMWPRTVWGPVATTTPLARPLTTTVPIKAILS